MSATAKAMLWETLRSVPEQDIPAAIAIVDAYAAGKRAGIASEKRRRRRTLARKRRKSD